MLGKEHRGWVEHWFLPRCWQIYVFTLGKQFTLDLRVIWFKICRTYKTN